MHFPTPLLTTLTLLTPLAHCIPAYVSPDPYHNLPVTCSAQSAPIPDYAKDPGWGINMRYCMDKLDNSGWNGAECNPTTDRLPGAMQGQQVVDAPPPADAKPLGPAVGFYKGGKGDDKDGASCFAACSDCLMKSIDAGQAVTTKCTLETAGMSCWMGFEMGG